MPCDCRNKTKIKFRQVKNGSSSISFPLLFSHALLVYDISIFHFTCAFDHNSIMPLCIFLGCRYICSPSNNSKYCRHLWKDIVIAYSRHATSLMLAYTQFVRTFGFTIPLQLQSHPLRTNATYPYTHIYIYHHVKNCLPACRCLAIIDYTFGSSIRFRFDIAVTATATSTLDHGIYSIR